MEVAVRGLTEPELAEVRAFPHAGSVAAADTLIAALLATLDEAHRTHNRWVSSTYGRDSSDSVLLYKSTHRKHSTASILLAEGVDPMVIRQILGHTRVAMTGHYARSEEPMRREALERLGRAVSA